MKELNDYFPLAFAEIKKLMAHGATTHRDDEEWREHDDADHLGHLDEHQSKHDGSDPALDGMPMFFDNESGQPQLTHVACRALMALEVYLGGGREPIQGVG